MKNSFFIKLRRWFERIHLSDTEIDTGEGKLHLSATVKFMIGWSVFLLLLIIFLLVAKPFKKDKNTAETATATDAQGQTIEYTPFERNPNESINAFIDSYLNALTTADINLIGGMVKDPGQLDPASLQLRAQKILGYSNVDCYIKPGLAEDSYVVYAIVNTQIADVEVRPLSLHRFYLIKNEYGGYIQDNTVGSDPEISAYLQKISNDPDVVELYDRVNKNNAEAAAQDPKLQEFYNSIGQSADVPAATEAPASEEVPAEGEPQPTEAPAEGQPEATEAPATEAPASEEVQAE